MMMRMKKVCVAAILSVLVFSSCVATIGQAAMGVGSQLAGQVAGTVVSAAVQAVVTLPAALVMDITHMLRNRSDGSGSIFEGTWVHADPGSSGDTTIIFVDDGFGYIWADGAGTHNQRIGTFVFDGINISFTVDGFPAWTTTYTLSGDTLRLEQGTGAFHWYGDFNRAEE